MQRLPLSSPAHAAALVAVGFPRDGLRLEALDHVGTGEKKTSWFLESAGAADAADLLKRSRSDHAKALWRTDPAHPFLAALAGVENLRALQGWLDDPAAVPSGILQPGGKLVRLGPPVPAGGPDLMRDLAGPPGFFQTNDLSFAAALIAAGFIPCSRILAGGALHFRFSSVTLPDLPGAGAMAAARQMLGGSLEPVALPGFPPGRHPFQYAFSAAMNLLSAPGAEAAAWQKPTHFFKSAKSALANDAALNRPGMEQKIMEHIAGV